jgi:urease accessory protein
MATSITMGLERLHLLQLVSPALPVGAFSYSEGLEVLQQRGLLAGGEPLLAWLQAELEAGVVAVETAALAPLTAALRRRAGAELAELDGWLLAQREAPELRAQQRQMGQSLLQLLADLGWPLPLPLPLALGWPGAFAWAALCLEIAAPAVQEAYLYGWAANQISAAVRLIPLGPTEGQRLQLQLAPVLAQRAQELAAADPRSLWSGGVGAGLAQLEHAALYSRLFRS